MNSKNLTKFNILSIRPGTDADGNWEQVTRNGVRLCKRRAGNFLPTYSTRQCLYNGPLGGCRFWNVGGRFPLVPRDDLPTKYCDGLHHRGNGHLFYGNDPHPDLRQSCQNVA